jgi:hypothetical protein
MQKAHPINQMSFKYVEQYFEAFDLTYLSATWRMELAPFLALLTSKTWEVVKASSGHYPQPFLISDIKNYGKDNPGLIIGKLFFLIARISHWSVVISH